MKEQARTTDNQHEHYRNDQRGGGDYHEIVYDAKVI